MMNMIPVRPNRFMRENPCFDFSDEFFRPFFSDRAPFKVDVLDLKDRYRLEAELPGVSRDAISVEIRDDALVISVKNEKNEEKTENGYVYRERSSGDMKRMFRLDGIDAEKAAAKFTDGLLTVELPKAEKENIRKIEIA